MVNSTCKALQPVGDLRHNVLVTSPARQYLKISITSLYSWVKFIIILVFNIFWEGFGFEMRKENADIWLCELTGTRCCIWHLFPCWFLQILEMGTSWPLCNNVATETFSVNLNDSIHLLIRCTFCLICLWCCSLKRSLQGSFSFCYSAFIVVCFLECFFSLDFMVLVFLNLGLSTITAPPMSSWSIFLTKE